MLSQAFERAVAAGDLLPRERFRPFPDAADREGWSAVDPEAARMWLAEAEAYAGFAWPALTMQLYATYAKQGVIMDYLHAYWERRSALGTLLFAECIERQGRYLEQIVNGIGVICEETTWVVPHHNGRMKRSGASVPDEGDHEVELFSSETAALLAVTAYLLREPLLAVGGERVLARIGTEVRRRLLEPFMEFDDYWWMGFADDKPLNNWNPWCNGNVLLAFLLLETDEPRRVAGIRKALRSLDEYIRRFPADGCCDEGPMYWGGAGGALMRALELMQRATNGRLNVFAEPLIGEIGRYYYRVHIHDSHFVSFADGDAKLTVMSMAYLYGKRIGDEALMKLGATAPFCRPDRYQWFIPSTLLLDWFAREEINRLGASAPYVRDAWMADRHVMTAREREGSARGLYLAAKGGTNAESHNHNDIGNFIVYADGLPVLIDLGTENYTAKTFGPQRYELWYVQSAYHNVPTVGGAMQMAGEQFRAEEVACALDAAHAELRLEMAAAYPAEAGIVSWRRKLRLERGKGNDEGDSGDGSGASIVVDDTFALERPAVVDYTLMTPWQPLSDGIGSFVLAPEVGRPVRLGFNADALALSWEAIPLADARLRRNWGDTVYRVILREKTAVLQGRRVLLIEMA
ncbi:heparinase II/III domain-containing protein [Paenibacillus cymbidii]|uniref:heparinase II/III domain-containing protein n=1 Tax=Paenibacillus cymbidii TaxID=1639034 RepID=UPI001080D5B9|nr:heparinase II/III family protein [Paenibacillus cymbidii]